MSSSNTVDARDTPLDVRSKRRCFIGGIYTDSPLRISDPECPHCACSLEYLPALSSRWVDIKFGLEEGGRAFGKPDEVEGRNDTQTIAEDVDFNDDLAHRQNMSEGRSDAQTVPGDQDSKGDSAHGQVTPDVGFAQRGERQRERERSHSPTEYGKCNNRLGTGKRNRSPQSERRERKVALPEAMLLDHARCLDGLLFSKHIDGDDHCLFRSCMDQTPEGEKGSRNLRQRVVEEVRSKRPRYSILLRGAWHPPVGSEEWQTMNGVTTWQCKPLLMCYTARSSWRVGAGQAPLAIPPDDFDTTGPLDPVYLLLHAMRGVEHYESLHRQRLNSNDDRPGVTGTHTPPDELALADDRPRPATSDNGKHDREGADGHRTDRSRSPAPGPVDTTMNREYLEARMELDDSENNEKGKDMEGIEVSLTIQEQTLTAPQIVGQSTRLDESDDSFEFPWMEADACVASTVAPSVDSHMMNALVFPPETH